MNTHVYSAVAASDPVPSFSVLHWNIDNAVIEQQHEDTKWSSRCERVAGMIEFADADIVCLNEMRQLPGESSIEDWLHKVCTKSGYDCYVQRRDPNPLTFMSAILWKRSKFFGGKRDAIWLTNSRDNWCPNGADPNKPNCPIAITVDLFPLLPTGKIAWDTVNQKPFTLTVCTTHFPMDELAKEVAIDALERWDAGALPHQVHMLLCGDFNFFSDLGGDGQRTRLRDNLELSDYGADGHALWSDPRKRIVGTFIGYEHDKFHCPVDVRGQMVPTSRLDHMFGKGLNVMERPMLIDRTMFTCDECGLDAKLRNRFPSDHLPMIGHFGFPLCAARLFV